MPGGRYEPIGPGSGFGSGGGGGTTIQPVTSSPNFNAGAGQLQIWFDPSGSDSNSGSMASPFLTPQFAFDYAAQWDYLNLYQPFIQASVSGTATFTISTTIAVPALINCIAGGILSGGAAASDIVYDATNAPLGNPLFEATGAGAVWEIDSFTAKVSGAVFRPQYFATITMNADITINDPNNSGLTYLANVQNAGTFFCVSFGGQLNLIFETATLGGIIQAQVSGEAIFQDAAVQLQPNTIFGNGIFFITEYSELNTFNCSYTNANTVSGGAAIVSYSLIRTSSGLQSDVPGGIFFDSTSAFAGRDIVYYPTIIGETNVPVGGELAKVEGVWEIQLNANTNISQLAVNNGDSIIPNVIAKQIARIPNVQTSSYTLAVTDQDGRVSMDAAGANTVTVAPFGHRGSIVAGTLYTTGTYTRVGLTGGSGAGAIATIVVSGGGVTSVTVTYSGLGYALSDVLSAAASNIGGTGSGFTFTITTVGVSFPVGTEIKVMQIGAGTTTPTAGTGVTGNNFGGLTQWQTVVLHEQAQDIWVQSNA